MSNEEKGSPGIVLKEKHPKEHKKDCPDFQPLPDGTLIGDWRYCNLSFKCQQMHYNEAGILVGCVSHMLMVIDPDDPEDKIYAPFCTGLLPRDERDDEKGVLRKNIIREAGKDEWETK